MSSFLIRGTWDYDLTTSLRKIRNSALARVDDQGIQLCMALISTINARTPIVIPLRIKPWWLHQMEKNNSALLAICAGNSPVTGEFPAQRSVTLSFNVFFDLRLNRRFSKQSWGWWFETPSHPLRRHCNALVIGTRLGIGFTLVLLVHLLSSTRRIALQWRHNGRDSVSNHQPQDYLLNLLSNWFLGDLVTGFNMGYIFAENWITLSVTSQWWHGASSTSNVKAPRLAPTTDNASVGISGDKPCSYSPLPQWHNSG